MNKSVQKKIIFYIGSLARGGAERVVVNLAEYLRSEKFDIIIATKEQRAVEYAVPEGVRRIGADISDEEMTKSRVKNFVKRVQKLRHIWKKERPDLIVSFIKKNNLMAILSSRGLRIPVLVAIRSAAFREYPGGFRMLAKVLFPMANGIIVQTEEQANYFGKIVKRKTQILPNAIHPNFIAPIYEGVRNNEIITVGRIDDNKNQIMLVEAFALIADKYPSMKVIIYGDGEEKGKIRELIQQKELMDRVILAGQIADIKAKIERARIFVLTSRIEGIPNAMIEAMACGVVPISTDFGGGGVRQLIRDGENGYIIPVDDVDALAKKLELILTDKELEERLRAHAVEVQNQFAPELVNQQWEQYFKGFMK